MSVSNHSESRANIAAGVAYGALLCVRERLMSRDYDGAMRATQRCLDAIESLLAPPSSAGEKGGRS